MENSVSSENLNYSNKDKHEDENEEEYTKNIINKLSPSLIKYFNINTNVNSNLHTDWTPPDSPGLKNSFVIIPGYYQDKKNSSLLDVDYYNIILDDIRNLRKLNEYQLEYIRQLDDDSKQKLFMEFNKLFDVIDTLLVSYTFGHLKRRLCITK